MCLSFLEMSDNDHYTEWIQKTSKNYEPNYNLKFKFKFLNVLSKLCRTPTAPLCGQHTYNLLTEE